MADDAENKNARDGSADLKQSFAWGQLFAGSLIGGLAVWKLLHQVTNSSVDQVFNGLSSAFGEVRDFITLPLGWFQVHASTTDRNLVVVSLILLSVLVRSLVQAPTSLKPFLVSCVTAAGVTGNLRELLGLFGADSTLPYSLLDDAAPWALGTTTLLAFITVLTPAFNLLLADSKETRQLSQFMLLNIVFSVAWGTVLLLLNWATS